ncbi:PLP-dependent aminotransferase family protein [Cuniculiplasma sp. SKW3]|uniref:aminotransferase-like domain-containing protein n=1 Tax=Cuniculiplasma sp. SKW3 TaxID=3400170 RepID=UPI003FD1B7B1
MKFNFSECVMGMKPSEIRELNKMASTPGLISLGGGMPSPETFPKHDLEEIMDYVMENYADLALQYGNTLGNDGAREVIADMLRKTEGIQTNSKNIIINSGSQQGLYELGVVLANPGDTVITEEPTYVGAVSAFSANRLRMEGMEMDHHGMIVDGLETKIRKLMADGRKPRFIYVIPTFQNPTGYTMPEERRKVLIEISETYNIPLIEDNPYGQLRYYGKPVSSIRSMKNGENTIYLGTFSKVMTPGLRLGYTVAPDDVMEKFNLIKQALDLATNSFSQYVALEYVKRGVIYKQIEENKKIYKVKRDRMINALKENMDGLAKWSEPEGGMFVWATLNGDIDTKMMREHAIKNGVAYVSGQAFTTNNTQKSSMRLNFTFGTLEQIEEGIKRIRKTVDSYREKQ